MVPQLSKSQSHTATGGQSVSNYWCRAPSGAHDQLLLFDIYGLVFVGRPLCPEDGSVFCIWYWSLLAQSFSGPSPLGLATIFYCLRFFTSFSSPPTTRRVTVEVFDPTATRVNSLNSRLVLLITHQNGHHRKTASNNFPIVAPRSCCTEHSENTASQLVHWYS
jgi:hypothetical protein